MPAGPSDTYIVTISSADIPVRLSNTHRFVNQAIIIGHKALRTVNTGTVYIGPSSVNGEQANPIPTEGVYSLTQVDLYDWYVDGAAGDGLVITCW